LDESASARTEAPVGTDAATEMVVTEGAEAGGQEADALAGVGVQHNLQQVVMAPCLEYQEYLV
jgi:hypothetical protein